jgi:uncharacterized heparinase superfamily protein
VNRALKIISSTERSRTMICTGAHAVHWTREKRKKHLQHNAYFGFAKLLHTWVRVHGRCVNSARWRTTLVHRKVASMHNTCKLSEICSHDAFALRLGFSREFRTPAARD